MPHTRTNALVAALGLSALLLAPAVPQANAELASPNVHVVQPGETLVQIADSLGVDLNTLVSLNKLDNPDALTVGQSLSVPGPSTASSTPRAAATSGGQQAAQAQASPAPTSASVGPAGSTYTVAAGDTLWAIARQSGTSVSALVEANGIDNPDALKVGSPLRIPGDGSRPIAAPPPAGAAPGSAAGPSSGSYTVQPGDTLLKISRQLGLSLGSLVQANGLDNPDRLAAGMVLKLPGGPPSAPAAQTQAQGPTRQHVVAVGETLKDIAAEEKVDLGVLIDVNNIDNPELLRVGQVVVVPPSPPDGPGDGSSRVASDGKPGTLAAATTSPPTPLPSAPAPKPANQAAGAPAATSAPTPAGASGPASASGAGPRPASSAQPQPSASGARTQPAGAPPASPGAAAPAPGASTQPARPQPGAPAPAPAAPAGPAPKPGEGPAEYAQRFLGARYVFGGSSPAGFDCSGFVWYVARQVGKPVPRGMQGEYNSGPHPKKEELKPGDVVFFQNTYKPGLSHNGFYLGNGKFIHAADERSGVTISDMNAPFWSSHWFGATRLS